MLHLNAVTGASRSGILQIRETSSWKIQTNIYTIKSIGLNTANNSNKNIYTISYALSDDINKSGAVTIKTIYVIVRANINELNHCIFAT